MRKKLIVSLIVLIIILVLIVLYSLNRKYGWININKYEPINVLYTDTPCDDLKINDINISTQKDNGVCLLVKETEQIKDIIVISYYIDELSGAIGIYNKNGEELMYTEKIDSLFVDNGISTEDNNIIFTTSDWSNLEGGDPMLESMCFNNEDYKNNTFRITYKIEYLGNNKLSDITNTDLITIDEQFSLCSNPKDLLYDEVQLIPVDEKNKNSDFSSFIDEFTEALENKDLDYILEHTSENIIFTFGEGNGITDFKTIWNLNDNQNESEFWDEMLKTIKLSFISNDNNSLFIAPYTFVNFPEEFDSYIFYVCTEENVRVRELPSFDSNIIKTISYLIVKPVNPPGETEGKWVNIILPDGTEGYVYGDYLRSPLDYRARFNYINEKWILEYFIAGD